MSVFAYAGTVSFLLSFGIRQSDEQHAPRAKAPSTRGYTLALVGAGLCWSFFCTLNSALAVGYQKNLAFVNTWVSLSASTLAVFAFSYLVQRKLDPFSIIFGALSGAIAVGCSADIIKNPAAAAVLGTFAGLVIFFTNYLRLFSAFSEDATGLGNLSMASGMIGSLYSAIIVGFYSADGGIPSQFDIVFARTFPRQAGFQVVGLIIAVLLGVASAALNGIVMQYTKATYAELAETF
jgi:ammonia channel protein AmtB